MTLWVSAFSLGMLVLVFAVRALILEFSLLSFVCFWDSLTMKPETLNVDQADFEFNRDPSASASLVLGLECLPPLPDAWHPSLIGQLNRQTQWTAGLADLCNVATMGRGTDKEWDPVTPPPPHSSQGVLLLPCHQLVSRLACRRSSTVLELWYVFLGMQFLIFGTRVQPSSSSGDTSVQPFPSPSTGFLGKFQFLGDQYLNSLIAKRRALGSVWNSLIPGPLICCPARGPHGRRRNHLLHLSCLPTLLGQLHF